MRINFQISGYSGRVDGSLRGAGGFATLNVMMTNHEKRIQAQHRRYVKRAAFYLRSVARNSMKRGRSHIKQLPTRYFDIHTGQFETGYKQTKHRTRSTPPNSPNYHIKGGAGLKLVWAEPYKGNKDTYKVAPIVFKSKGSLKVNFSIHKKLSKGGTGKMLAPINNNDALTKAQMFQRGFKKARFDWIPVKYKPRPYMHNAVAPTRKKFPALWYGARK